MLHGVLNMPPECWAETPIDQQQRFSRYVQASKRIIDLEDKLATQKAANTNQVSLNRSLYAANESTIEERDKALERAGDKIFDARRERDEALAKLADIEATLLDENLVHLNTLRGTIAKLSDANVKHVYPHLFSES